MNAAGLSPILCAFLTMSYGNSSVSSKCDACGRISFTAKSWASSLIAFCSSVSVKSSGTSVLRVLGDSLRENGVAVLVDGLERELARLFGLLRAERDRVAGDNHSRKPARHPAQLLRAPRGLTCDDGGDAHLQHPVRDHTG